MKVIVGAVLLLVSIAILATMPVIDPSIEKAEYCENVEIWKDTNGRYGHPNFRNRECE